MSGSIRILLSPLTFPPVPQLSPPLQRHFAEIQFHCDTDIEDVKHRIYAHTGSKPEFMELVLNGQRLEDGRTLGSYYPKDHDVIRVVDHDPDSAAANGGLDDVTLVKKYTMTEEEYSKRPNTYRAWKAEQLRKDPGWTAPWLKKAGAAAAPAAPAGPVESLESVQARVKVGARCECSPGARRGEVKFVGYIAGTPAVPAPAPAAGAESKDGAGAEEPQQQVFVGVAFDEPLGKNDGTAKGKRYFTCGAGYGAFLKPDTVVVGDFPVRDPFASDDEGADGKPEGGAAGGEDVMEEL